MELPHRLDTGDVLLAYEATGSGPLVICAHGFPDCARSFRHQVPALVKAGFRVAIPSMRAYAPSGVARSGRYDAFAVGGDLLALADALSPNEAVRLIGHDWGAVAAYAASARAPERVSHLVTAAVPHLRVALRSWLTARQLKKSWYMGLFQLDGYAERRVRQRDMALIDELWAAWSPGYRCPPEEMTAIKASLAPNLTDVLSYYRALRKPRAEILRSLMAPTRVPALYLHGVDDGCIGVDTTRGVARAYERGLQIHHLEDAGHFVHLEQPARFNALVVRFLTDG